MTLALSQEISFNNKTNDNILSNKIKEDSSKSAEEILLTMVESLDREELKQAMKSEIKRILINHDQLINMLQTRTDALEQQNTDYKSLISEHQKKYEKAVREMKFFRKKYEIAMEMNKQYVNSIIATHQQRPRSHSIESNSTNDSNYIISHHHQQQQQKNSTFQMFPVTPTSPQPLLTLDQNTFGSFELNTDYPRVNNNNKTNALTSRSSSTSTNNSSTLPQWNLNIAQLPENPVSNPPDTSLPPIPTNNNNQRRLSTTTASTSNHSLSTLGLDDINENNNNNGTINSKEKPNKKKQAWQMIQQALSPANSLPLRQSLSNGTYPPPTTTTTTIAPSAMNSNMNSALSALPMSTSMSTAPSNNTTISNAPSTISSTTNNSLHSVSMTPVRSSTTTSGYAGSSLIQQRKVDPLIFGGSDGLWDTISKSQGSDVTVEKTIR